jgi:hypothetical protein
VCEAVELEPVAELRVRGPVIAALPAELLSLHTQHCSDEDRARLVEQPVRLRLAGAERRGRIEAVEQPVTVEEEQPILRATLRGEEEQLELVGRQQLVAVEAEHDLAVALGQVRCQFEHAVGAHPRRAHPTTIGSHGVKRALLLCRGARRCRITRPHARFRASPGRGRRRR